MAAGDEDNGIDGNGATGDDNNDNNDSDDDDDGDGDGDGAMGSGATRYNDEVVVVIGW